MECVTSKYKSILSKKVEILLLQILTDPVVTEVSQKLGKSVPQVLLRWAVQQGMGMLLSVYLNISQSSDVHNKFIQIIVGRSFKLRNFSTNTPFNMEILSLSCVISW